jgi:hypothetical protein
MTTLLRENVGVSRERAAFCRSLRAAAPPELPIRRSEAPALSAHHAARFEPGFRCASVALR